MAKLLRVRSGIPADHMKVLLGEKATLRGIRAALGTWLSKQAGPNDLAILYLSAHGGIEPKARYGSDDGTTKYLYPQDVDASDLYSSALPMAEIADILSNLRAKVKLVWLDTCYSGASGSPDTAFAGMKLRSLQSPGIVYAGSILAAIPCCAGGCCCLGLPVGIWAIVVMQDEEVKAAFEP